MEKQMRKSFWRRGIAGLSVLLLLCAAPQSAQAAVSCARESTAQSASVRKVKKGDIRVVRKADVPANATETAGVLRVGMEANYAPYNWSQTNADNDAVPIANSPGEYANGYDVQMARKLAEHLGLELEIVKSDWDGLVPALLSGKIDAVIAGMSPTAERKKQIDFTDYYYTSDLVVVVKKGSAWEKAQTLSDFAGARITAQMSTSHYEAIDQMPGVDKQVAMDSFPTMITALLAGKIDGYLSERPGAMSAQTAHKELTYVHFAEGQGFDTALDETSTAVGLKQGSPLREPLNEALLEIPEEERQTLMQQMIEIDTFGAPVSEEVSFFESVGTLFATYGSAFLRGAGMTLFIALLSTTLGFCLGLIVQVLRSVPKDPKKSIARNSAWRVLQFFLNAYIEIFRGTPMMVQAMLIYYGSKLFFDIDMNATVAAILIVSVNTGAYLAEVIRGGIDSVDPGQMEACQALGMTHGQSMRHVILPQSIKAILPSIGNEFVVNIKDTSVLNVISVTELFFITRSVAGSTYLIFQSYFITAVIYFVLTFAVTRLINAIGRRSGEMKPFVLTSTTVAPSKKGSAK